MYITASDYITSLDPVEINISASGDEGIVNIYPFPVEISLSVEGHGVAGVVVRDEEVVIAITLTVDGDYEQWLVPAQREWVWTSRIGYMNFDDSDTGEVTKRPMSYPGWIYAIKKLGNQAIVFGENGVSVMVPSGTTWGLQNIHPVGIKGKNTVVVANNKVLFIDNQNQLGVITNGQGVSFIDYSPYFEQMSANTVMSYDPALDATYICDGTYGFVYTDSGLGQGPTNISGVGYRDDTLFATAPSSPLFAPFQITTDIIDFGVRTEKEIHEIDFGMAVVVPLYACIDYRWNKAQSFFTSPWVKADYQGRTFHYNISGVEFRIKAKLLTYEYVELDYVNVLGKVAELKPFGAAA